MFDLPSEPMKAQEYSINTIDQKSIQEELQELDLSFYNSLLGGMCSGSSSSGPTETIKGEAPKNC